MKNSFPIVSVDLIEKLWSFNYVGSVHLNLGTKDKPGSEEKWKTFPAEGEKCEKAHQWFQCN
jgi:hypothetical protein